MKKKELEILVVQASEALPRIEDKIDTLGIKHDTLHDFVIGSTEKSGLASTQKGHGFQLKWMWRLILLILGMFGTAVAIVKSM